MSNIEQLRAKIQDIILLGTAFDSADLEDRVNEAFDDFESQSLTVIAPPLEWGEWESIQDGKQQKHSQCKKFTLIQTPRKGLDPVWSAIDLAKNPKHVFVNTSTEKDTIWYCQRRAQAAVDKALEGCNVIPYRDPQGLVDALEKIKDTLFTQGYPLNESDSNTFKDMGEDVDSILKAWEKEK